MSEIGMLQQQCRISLLRAHFYEWRYVIKVTDGEARRIL